MKNNFWVLILSTLFLAAGCQNTDDDVVVIPDPTTDPTELTCDGDHNPCDLVFANNSFGLKTLKMLNGNFDNQNIFISPTSIATALSMTMNGADGQTLEDMMDALELRGWTLDEINAAYKTLLLFYPTIDESVKLTIANSIWYKENYNILETFLNVNIDTYNSQVEALDFTQPNAVDPINDWVNDKTNGLIEDIFQSLPGNVVMVLCNAIYFKGDWRFPFDTEQTYNTTFNLSDGSTTQVDMMNHYEIDMPYMQTEMFQAVDIPYGDSVMAMTAFLPKNGFTEADIINELSAQNWEDWTGQLQSETLILGFPKFEMEFESKLNDALTDLGMGVIFGSGADFSNINGTGGLRVSEVKHKSFIKVDEVGTEAAAVTAVVIIETSVPQIPTLIFNKPFVFVIRDHKTNSVLFVGKMMNPAS